MGPAAQTHTQENIHAHKIKKGKFKLLYLLSVCVRVRVCLQRLEADLGLLAAQCRHWELTVLVIEQQMLLTAELSPVPDTFVLSKLCTSPFRK